MFTHMDSHLCMCCPLHVCLRQQLVDCGGLVRVLEAAGDDRNSIVFHCVSGITRSAVSGDE